MRRYLFNILLVLAVFGAVQVGAVYTTGTGHQYTQTTLTTSQVVAVAGTVYVAEITVANKTAADATFTVLDRGTDCESGGCNFLKTVTIAANSTYTIAFNGQIAVNGVIWYASTNSALDAKLHFRTRMSDQQ